MRTRREFLTDTAITAAVGLIGLKGASAAEMGTKIQPQAFGPRGGKYEAVIPDTLELADRAQLSVNNLTHNVDPEDYYYVFQGFSFAPDSKGLSLADRTFDITGKNLRALPLLRAVCGSTEHLDIQSAMMKAMLKAIAEDGLLYYPTPGYRIPDTSYPAVNAIFSLACENQYAVDGDQQWLQTINKLGEALHRIAIRVEDRAYYPPECTITHDGKWVWNTRGIALIPYNPPEEPYMDSQGLEGCVKFEQGYAMRALIRAHKYGSKTDMLELLQRLKTFQLKLGFWENTTLQGMKGNEHGMFYGHFHGNTGPLLALLDLAETTNDAWLKEFVREGYEHALRTGAARLGWVPSWFMPLPSERPESTGEIAEGCAVGEMAQLGVRLTDAGLGDYWDQVDSIIRNQLIEQQITSVELMQRYAKGGASSPYLDRYVGGYGAAAPTWTRPEVYGCCSANTPIGLYYAWHGITRFNNGVATVNLLLNRASQWVDIDSHLPYEGRVDIRNKQARTILVRVPMWVDTAEVKSSVSGSSTKPAELGRYLVFDGLKPGNTVTVQFPIPESTERYWLAGREFAMTMRGSTVTSVKPELKDPTLIALYQRPQYKTGGKAPLRKTTRFAAEVIPPLQ